MKWSSSYITITSLIVYSTFLNSYGSNEKVTFLPTFSTSLIVAVVSSTFTPSSFNVKSLALKERSSTISGALSLCKLNSAPPAKDAPLFAEIATNLICVAVVSCAKLT